MKILTNHMGYSADGPKKVVIRCADGEAPGACRLVDAAGRVCRSLLPCEAGPVANWNKGTFWTADFTDYTAEGEYQVEAEGPGGCVRSHPFRISGKVLTMRMISAVGYYFKAQRDSGEWLAADRALPFAGPREGIVDAHGGWYDATGDYGIHMSHLSHSTWHNPQQMPFSAYAFFKVHEFLTAGGNEEYTMVKRRALDEGFWGADFLLRMRAPSGSFYRTISRAKALDAVHGTRTLGFEYKGSSAQFSATAATADSETVTDENYECSLRCGGGLAIAALAAAGRHFYLGAGHSQQEYVLAAKEAWAHLSRHNEAYTNDGKWNLVDEYCALIAVTELWRTTGEYEYLAAARDLAARIGARTVPTGPQMRRLEMASGRPFYSAADEGMPLVALLQYAETEPDPQAAEEARRLAGEIFRYQLHLTDSVVNPFGYPRMECLDGGTIHTRFFFSHESTAAPWWQGDNARLASLSAAARMLSRVTPDPDFAARCRKLAQDTLDWIMGCNPFDACMIEGYGYHNIQYFYEGRYDFLNCPGGICNGITSGLHDEEGIEFVTRPTEEVSDNWRWAEQWIPHASWYLYAMALKFE